MATNRTLPVQLTTLTSMYGQIPNPRVPFTAPVATVLLRHMKRTPALPLYHHAEISPFPARACHHLCCPIRPPVARVYRALLPLAYCPPSVVRWSTCEPLITPLLCFHYGRCEYSSSPPPLPFLQVPKCPPTSEKVPETWSAFPTTEGTWHHHRASVRSAIASPSCFDALSVAFPCWAGAWVSHNAMGEHLPIIWPLGARGRSHAVGHRACTAGCRASRARSRAPSERCG
jgi:hypothetical protein